MTARVVVGYTATKLGRDALAVGARLARAIGADVDVAIILPMQRGYAVPPDPAYARHLRAQASQWLAEAIDHVADDITAHPHKMEAESFGAGLIDLADAVGASYIVVGAAKGGPRGKHRLGSTTTELLHSSDVPVVLVPRGARKVPADAGIPRLTVAVGTRPGADALVQETAELAAVTGASVRLLSLLPVDLPATADTAAIRLAGSAEASDVLAVAKAELPAAITVDVVVGEGDSIEAAIGDLDWAEGEMLLAGSSRLAQPRRLFLGSTAAKMLHVAPVPVIVVPRTRTQEGVQR